AHALASRLQQVATPSPSGRGLGARVSAFTNSSDGDTPTCRHRMVGEQTRQIESRKLSGRRSQLRPAGRLRQPSPEIPDERLQLRQPLGDQLFRLLQADDGTLPALRLAGRLVEGVALVQVSLD